MTKQNLDDITFEKIPEPKLDDFLCQLVLFTLENNHEASAEDFALALLPKWLDKEEVFVTIT